MKSERNIIFWPSVMAALVLLVTALAGIVFRLGPNWHFVANVVTALTALLLAWEVQRQRKRNAARTAEQIEELLKLLRRAKADFSSAELKTIEAELQRLQFNVLKRASLKR